MAQCRNTVGGWYRRRLCPRQATGDDGLCNICRGYLKRSMNAVRRDLDYKKSLAAKGD